MGLGALCRFFALCGSVAVIRCDCGTNFVGAKSEFEKAITEMDKERIEKYVNGQGCEWKFNPPHASHFGGVWERQIGTIRRILDGMLLKIGSSQLDDELLLTLMAEVTAIINNHPISAISADTDEPIPLSPAALLTLKQRPVAPPPGKFVPEDLYARRRWRKIQYLADQFWIRWKREYLQNQQSRSKWERKETDLTVGDLVLVKDKELPRNKWQMGKVTESIKSEDGKIRKARILGCKDGKSKSVFRPITELVLLLAAQNGQETEYKDRLS
ncbi:uncharacterized protein LOC114540496 [Dendronephthya gigantea]|uniref:uncharacterized protein LOC114540496 n=1 Tax=Dendronephthya gigantea TaxID=151771 RepID=UPI00106CCCF4|nr:uncharacterized protein LOC114540496 [Dendronephthya gigantea]